MRTFLFLVVFISCGVCVLSDNNIIWNETPLNVEYPFSDTYFKWIKDDIAIVLTRYDNLSTEVWRTIDGGQTWKSLKSQLQRSEILASQPGFLYPNPVDISRFYIRGESNVSWTSNDMGATWTTIFPVTSAGEFKRFVNLEWHPMKPEWALASVGFSLVNDVYYTNDFGKTWNFVSRTNRVYTWGDAGTGSVPISAIYLNLPGADLYAGTFSVTTDFGKTFTTIQTNTLAAIFLEKQIFSLKQLPSSNNEAILKVTPHIGSSYKIFYDATFPFGKDIENNGYSLLDDHTGAVFMGINHNRLYDSWGNIYVSNSIGNQYSLSSAHVSQMWPFFDFVRIQGIDGVYITNVVKDWKNNAPKKESLLSTYITFDNGGNWQSLNPPHFDSNGQRIQCTGTCSLHLHGITSLLELDPYGPVYSTPNSIGIIIASGNIGENLLWDADSVNTYMSRDGGLNWIELRKGNSIYEVGDHGAIIVFAPFGSTTDRIYYTLDEGLTVKSLIFSSPFVVDNIRVEPTATGEKFMVIGSRQGNGIVIGVDFSKVYNSTCVGSQYETWTPSNGKKDINGLSCLLGKDIVYRRRNRTSLCFNVEQVDPVVSIAYCACTEDDWECDMGFERDENNNCVLSANANTPTYPPEVCPPGTNYNITKGYRQIAGTSCRAETGVNHWGQGPFDCPTDNTPTSGSKGWIAAVVLVILVLVIIVGAFVAMRSEWVRERVPFIKKLHGWKVGYFGMRNAPDTIGEELESQNDSEPFSIGGDEEETGVIKSTLPSTMPKFDDDTFNPRT